MADNASFDYTEFMGGAEDLAKAIAKIKTEQAATNDELREAASIVDATLKKKQRQIELESMNTTAYNKSREIAAQMAHIERERTSNGQTMFQFFDDQLAKLEEQKAIYDNQIKSANKMLAIERLRANEEDRRTQSINKRASLYTDKIFGGVERMLGKLPGGDILKDHLNIDGAKQAFGKGMTDIAKMSQEGTLTAGKAFGTFGKSASAALSKIAAHPVALVILALAAAVYASVKRFIELDKAAEAFRHTTGLISTQMVHIGKYAREINVEMRRLGVTIEDAYKSAAAMVETFQTSYAVTSGVMRNVAQLAANIGVAETDSVELYQTFLGMGKTTSTMATDLMNAAVALAEANGVPIAAVFRDIANASNDAMIFLGRSPILMLRTAVEARRLGTTMESLAKSAKGLLNFQESINAEMEASAITGRTLNFQSSRQLAFAGELVKSRQEALRQIEKLGEFQSMSVYQQEAVARAAGMEVQEIVKMQAQQKQLSALKEADFDLWLKMDTARKAADKATTKSLAEQGRDLAKQQLRQAEITKLTNQLKAIWTDISDALLPIAQVIIPAVLFVVRSIALVLKFITGIIRGMLSPLDNVLKKFDGISEKVNKIVPSMDTINSTVEKVGKSVGVLILPTAGILKLFGKTIPVVSKIGYFIEIAALKLSEFGKVANFVAGKLFTIGGIVGKLGGILAKWAGPIGLVIMGVQTLWNWVHNLIDIWSDVHSWTDAPMALLKSVAAFGTAAANALLSPIDTIMDWFGVKIPNGIVAGIVDVGPI